MNETEIKAAMQRFGISRKEAETLDYVGDGVYCSFDGYHIWVRTLEGNAIAFEARVWKALCAYVGQVFNMG